MSASVLSLNSESWAHLPPCSASAQLILLVSANRGLRVVRALNPGKQLILELETGSQLRSMKLQLGFGEKSREKCAQDEGEGRE